MRMAAGKVEYRKEFFDRDYTFREAYGRVWKYARKYRLRLAVRISRADFFALALTDVLAVRSRPQIIVLRLFEFGFLFKVFFL